MTNPIRPEEVVALKSEGVPEAVILAFNYCIAANFLNGSATVYQDAVVDRIVSSSDLTRAMINDNKWLDVEDIYRQAGWIVEYDKPAYNESYRAYFTFKAPNWRSK